MSRKHEALPNKIGTTIKGVVRPRGNGACVVVPKKWMNKCVEVKIIKRK